MSIMHSVDPMLPRLILERLTLKMQGGAGESAGVRSFVCTHSVIGTVNPNQGIATASQCYHHYHVDDKNHGSERRLTLLDLWFNT